LQGHNRVEVSAIRGGFNVADNHGVLLASVQPGSMMMFNMQEAGAAAPATYTGKLRKETDRCAANGGTAYYIEVAGVKYQVTGDGLDAYVGKEVTVTGTLTAATAAGAKCAAGIIAASSVAPVSGGAATAGMAVSTKWIIAGVVLGAAGLTAGLVAANQSSSSSSP
jgi:hypothetical protein